MRIELEVVGVAHIESTLSGIGRRATRLAPAFRQALHVLERGEQAPFKGGDLIDTGRLRASLTQPTANDAIREAHNDVMVFGTSVPYARAAASKAGEPVLRVSQDDRRDIAALVLRYIIKGL